jgi:hypothetical protein
LHSKKDLVLSQLSFVIVGLPRNLLLLSAFRATFSFYLLVYFCMKRFSFASLIEKLQQLIRRFPVTLLLLAGVAGLILVEINAFEPDIRYHWWAFFIVGTIISLAVALGTENTGNRLWQYGLPVISVLLWGVRCLFLPAEERLHFDDYLQTGIIGAVFLIAVFFISFLKKNQDAAFWTFTKELIQQWSIAFLFGCVLFAGLCLAVYSLDTLFGIDIAGEVYQNLSIICFVLFSPVYFLANIPGKTAKYSREMSFHKVLKILGLYILMPVLGIYTLILYAYLARIVVAWELPNGWVSTLVSTLAAGGLSVLLILYPVYLRKENRAAVLLSRYSGLLLLPLLALMTVGIFRRIGDYGLTINRCYILLLNIWFYAIFIYLSVTRSKAVKWILISPAVILLLASVGPWRVSRITQIALQNRLETHFSQLDFLKNGKISLSDSPVFFRDMDRKEKEKIKETIEYLADTYGVEDLQPFFEDDIAGQSKYDIIHGLSLSPPGYASLSFGVNIDGVYFQDVASYRSFVPVKQDRRNKTQDVSLQDNSLHYKNKVDDRSFSIPLKETALQLIKGDGDNYVHLSFSPENKACIIQGEGYFLLITHISGERYFEKADSLQINSFEGYLFYK